MSKALAITCVAMTIVLTVYGQLIVKWRVEEAGELPAGFGDRAEFLARLVTDPWVLSVFLAAAVAALSWMIALTRFDLSVAYPFVSLTFVLVLLLSGVFFDEPVTAAKVISLGLIVTGLIVGSTL